MKTAIRPQVISRKTHTNTLGVDAHIHTHTTTTTTTTKALRSETAFPGYENLSKRKYITQIFTKLLVQFSLLSSNDFYVLKRVCIER